MKDERIKDIMTRDVECATPAMSVREAAEKMKSHNIGSLPVCEGKKVVGVITDRDVTVRSTASGADPNATKVESVMSRDIVSVKPDDTLQRAEQLMHDRQLRRLPVMDDQGELVGYLAMARVARKESPEQAGRVLKGVSQAESPAAMASYQKNRG
jgi:CBS domain-containing protein